MKLTIFYHIIGVLFQLLSIIFFSKGFFMVREFLPDVNTIPTNQKENIKVVVILFDAFRADFADSDNQSFMRRMQKENPNKTLLYLAISDTPTVTMSRIQALSTGNLPSFINLKANFYAQQMEEDNLIWQMNRANKTSVFQGDDTWGLLFPREFTRVYPMDSFEVSDLNSVDNGVIENIFPNLHKTDWSLMIGHFLGLDHAGHTFDSKSQQIQQKLIQYSKFLDDFYAQMDNSTILIVIGDHGMTSDGNHGGNSDEETNTIIFATYKGEKVFFKEFGDCLQDTKNDELSDYIDSSFNFDSQLLDQSRFIRKVSQIDLVPTIANILNISIPFSSLGMYIPEFTLKDKNERISITIEQNFQKVIGTLDQVMKYIEKVQQRSSKFPTHLLNGWNLRYHKLKLLNTIESFHALEAQALLYEIQNMARKLWNEFDYTLMKLAMIQFILVALLTLQIVRYLHFASEAEYQPHIDSKVQILVNHKPQTFAIDEQLNLAESIRSLYQNKKLFGCIVVLLLGLYNLMDLEINHFLCIIASIISIYFSCDIQIRLSKQKKLQNINHINTDDNHRAMKESRLHTLFSIVMWLKLKIGHAWILLALTYMRAEDESLFQVYLNNLVLFVSVDMISRFIRDRKNLSIYNQTIYSFTSLFCLFIAEQFDTNSLKLYDISYLKMSSFQYLFQNIITSTIIPAIILQFLLRWVFTYNQFQKEKNLNILKIMLHVNLFVVSVFYALQFTDIDTQSDLMRIYIPRIIYLLSLAGIALTLVLIKNAKREFISLQFLVPLLLLTGQSSLAVFACFFVALITLWKSLSYHSYKYGAYFFIGCVAILTNYFWFMLGNRCQLAAIKVDRGYLGFRKYNFYLTGSFLILSQLNFHFVGVLLMPIISDIFVKAKQVTKIAASRRFHMMLFQTHYMVQMMITAINCYYNRHELLLTNDFAPKFLFDLGFFVFISLLSLFL